MKKNSKSKKLVKMEYILIPIYARCCTLCGTHFDENGICGNGHQKGVSYPKPK